MGRCEGRVDIETEWNLKPTVAVPSRDAPKVDIETEWNLKSILLAIMSFARKVDIETEWNLKFILLNLSAQSDGVDIETEWNLKKCSSCKRELVQVSRYRNRVEFKATSSSSVYSDRVL